jgi:predicted nucleic acid-binding protein
MSVDAFLDTNVLIYAAAGHRDEPRKNALAWSLLDAANFGLSGQVLAEFYANVTRKLAVPLSVADAALWIDRLCEAPVVAVDADLVREGVRHSERYKINYWDGAILAAAERLGAPVLYTEDLNHDQTYGSVRAVNPFRQD